MKNKAFTIIEVLVVIAIFAICFILLTPVVHITKERARRINCANNLMQISLGLHMYAADHNKKFPADLKTLYPDYVKDKDVFDCPASRPEGTPENSDYAYVTGLSERSGQNEIIAYDLDGNHKGRHRNILRLGGAVEWQGVVAKR